MKDLFRDLREIMDLAGSAEPAVALLPRGSQAISLIARIPGDASSRRYYRVTPRNGEETYVLMRTEPFPKEGKDLSFLAVQRHLVAAGVDVPAVIDVDPERGFVLLEDLGDVTLLRHLQDVSSPDVERHLYERVIDDLVRLQVGASPARRPANLEAFRLRFDLEKLMWEVNFTIEHFYEQYLKRKIPDGDRAILRSSFTEICQRLAAEPVVFTHRDFHCRNVMVPPVRGGRQRLTMIDFQDARMGPAQYDLASLLKDSYYQLEEGQIERLIDYYVARWEAETRDRIDRGHFREIFDLMGVQRNFKAIGSFASFLNKRGDASYLKYIGNTFENIRRTLLKYPAYSSLREVLFHYYYF